MSLYIFSCVCFSQPMSLPSFASLYCITGIYLTLLSCVTFPGNTLFLALIREVKPQASVT
uniref:Uncharacterized protein n=2 Tax=Anguilla anguilla TaxID=7936 RepID=A0A0E9S0T7_ANGAN